MTPWQKAFYISLRPIWAASPRDRSGSATTSWRNYDKAAFTDRQQAGPSGGRQRIHGGPFCLRNWAMTAIPACSGPAGDDPQPPDLHAAHPASREHALRPGSVDGGGADGYGQAADGGGEADRQKSSTKVVHLLMECRHLYSGHARPTLWRAILNFYMHLLSENVTLVRSNAAGEIFEQALPHWAGRWLLAISFPRYSNVTVNTVKNLPRTEGATIGHHGQRTPPGVSDVRTRHCWPPQWG